MGLTGIVEDGDFIRPGALEASCLKLVENLVCADRLILRKAS